MRSSIRRRSWRGTVAASTATPILVSKALAARLLSISIDTFERAVMLGGSGRRVLFAIADLGLLLLAHHAPT